MKRAIQLLALALLVAVPAAHTTRAVAGQPLLRPSTVYVQWLTVAADRPETLYVGGTYRCTSSDEGAPLDQQCAVWAVRSTDAGTSWTSLSAGIGGTDPHAEAAPTDNPDAPAYYCSYSITPLTTDARGQQVAVGAGGSCFTPSSSYQQVLYSPDGGAHWPDLPVNDSSAMGYGAGISTPTFSPAAPYRLFGVSTGSDGSPIVLATLDNLHWHTSGSPATVPDPGQDPSDRFAALVPDPAHPSAVYADMENDNSSSSDQQGPAYVAHSTDTGATWSRVHPPAGVKALAVEADPAQPGSLVARSLDAGVPADRRYYSSDGGARWTSGACAGDYRGHCPRFTLLGARGSGQRAAVQADGVYAYTGHGASTTRLPITFPVPWTSVVAAASGSHPGGPLYVLGNGTDAAAHGQLYRSVDGGATWKQLNPGLLPVSQSPSTLRGSLAINASHHAVAPAFVALYRTLGLHTTGYPIDEAYSESGVLTQDFERLRLERHGSRVAVAPLGSLAIGYGIVPFGRITPDPYAETPASYSPSPVFARFWKAHGGASVLGRPISNQFTATNGDGSGRKYVMQYYANARLEAHPENKNPKYAIQLGLLGIESARARGWLTAPS